MTFLISRKRGLFPLILFLLILCVPTDLFAQPANDNWANASEIVIGGGGFERGVFQSDTVDVTGATNEFGEFLDNPSYPKTVWFKFTVPTQRVVRVKVLQPTEILESTAAGFVVYEKTSSVPNSSNLAVFTPFYSFASYSENVCLGSGEYYIQAVAKNTANSNIFVELDVVHTYGVSQSESTDLIDTKYDFGVLTYSMGKSVNWGCTSMDSEAERAHITGPDSLEYNKSIWAKFTTDDHIDLFFFRLSAYSAPPVFVQIWEGDIDSADVGNITPIYQIKSDLYYDHYLPCILDTNTTYTIQVVAKETFTSTNTLSIGHIGEGEVTGAYPQEASFHPNNQLGMLSPVADPGVDVTSHDFFSCAANLEIDSIVCGTVNPPDTAYIGTDHFELTTWFTFSTDAESNTSISTTLTRLSSVIGAGHYMGIRIYHQTIDNDCINYNYPVDLYYEGIFPANGLINLQCLPPGDYAIQLLGRTSPIIDGSNFYYPATHLGSRINISLNSQSVPALVFGLDAAGEVDWINGGAPLSESIDYVADTAYFSCTKTVLPDTIICEPQVDRGIYRQVVIGDADGDALPDSGMLVISGLAAYNISLNQASNSPFYKGDASALAAAQSMYSWPGTIDGLEPYDGCNLYNADYPSYYGPPYFSADHNVKKYCVTPGTYTLASVGDSVENGLMIRPTFRFEKTVSQFSNPAAPEDMGDIIAQGLTVTSQDDFFSCLDNPDTIAGFAPCGGYTKQLYREFYVSQPCKLAVNSVSANYPYSEMRLFSGRVSDVGIDGLTLAPFHGNGCYSGHPYGDFSTPPCSSVPSGWYTVVSYGFGPNYENNYDFHETHLNANYLGGVNGFYSIDKFDRVIVAVDTNITPGPFYNRPYLACNTPDTVKYVNVGTPDFPSAGTLYNFCQEYFSAQTDTPMVNLPINACMDAVKLSYFVFTTDDEYNAVIGGITNYYSELYDLDVREDSALFLTTDPLISCESFPNNMAVCRLQPGTYTLVVYGLANQQCVHFQPNISVSPVENSRFDWAATAYDFGLIPPDNTPYGGAVGDVHPNNTNYLPSNDFMYCSTGASDTDPVVGCGYAYNPEIYPDSINNVYFDIPGSGNEYMRRNLWYTFVLQGTGDATVQVRNLTNGWTPGFTIFESDVDGTLPYSSLLGTAELDSTDAQGLTFVANNGLSGYCHYNKPETVSFQHFDDPCVIDSSYRRYYVLVEMKYGTPLQMQVDVQVTWDPIEANPQDPVYDYFYEANVLGAGEIAPPYSNTPLVTDSLYSGGWGNLSCATSDTTDNTLVNCNPLKTLWYKVIIDEPGYLHIGTETDAANPSIRLLQHVNAPDSIVSPNGDNGLLNLGYGSYSSLNSTYPMANWSVFCLDAGTYYVNLYTCNAVDTSEVRIHAYFQEIAGNNCTNAPFVEAPTLGVYNLSDPVGCHKIGADFGEDGSDMGCLLGPTGYLSSWFKFSYTGTDLVDILFQLNLSSLSYYGGPDQVRYRLFYGDDCASMIVGSECSVNAFINNSVACVSAAEGDFYVQVTYPASSQGTLGFRFTVSENTNPDCNPFFPSLLTSDYVYQMNCTGDSLIFTNYSTSGSNLTYFWDFGQGGNTSTLKDPVFTYPSTGDYTVSLSVINPASQDTVTSSQLVHFEIGSSPLELGADQTICLGETATLGGFIPQSSYVWSTAESTPEIDVQTAGDYYLDLTLNGCTYSDTVSVSVIDLSLDLGADVEMCLGDTASLAYIGSANPSYTWSTGAADSSLTITQEGTYWLELNQGSCTRADTVNVIVHDLSFDLGNDTTICAGTSFYHYPDLSSGLSYNWSTGSTIDSILIAVADTFSLEVGYAGCTATSEMIVSVLDLELELGADTTICIGESLTIIPQTNTSVNYLWNDGSTNATLSTSTPGWYGVDVEAFACHSIDSLYVSVLDLSFELPEDTTICLGAILNIDPQLSPGLIHTWNTGSSATSIIADTAGVYQLTVDSIGCSAQSDIEVAILDLTFSLGPDSIICDGATIVLSPDNPLGDVYTWSDNSTATSLQVDTTGMYALEVTKDGCSATDNVAVTVFYVDAQLSENLTACLNDTTLLAVSGADSLAWNAGLSDISAIDALNFNFHPSVDGSYNWTAFENGCQQTGSFDFEVVQPYIPSPTYDAIYCRNEVNITPPIIDFTNGTYSLNGTPISTIDIATQGTSDFEILYTYTDTNTCAYEIILDYSIVDTTTISMDPFDPICADASALNLTPFLSDGLGETSVLYDLTNWTVDPAFHTDSLQQNITSPLAVPIRYTYVNGDNCQSIIDDEIIVHPLPVVAFSVTPICVGDTAVFTNTSSVNGSTITAQEWTFQSNGSFSGSVPTELSYNTAGFYAITLEVTSDIGCSTTFTDTLEVMALPVISADAFGPFCLNDGDIGVPTISPAAGDLTWNGTAVTAFDTYDMGSGTHDFTYSFTNSNGCYNELTSQIVVNDTTTISLDPFDPICADASALNLTPFLSDGLGETSVLYDLTNWTVDPAFHTDSLQQNITSPLAVPIRYTYVNGDNCQSIIDDEIIVHPLPVVAFSVTPICVGDTAVFTNTSSVNGSAITAQEWTFQSNGSFSGSVPTELSYNTAGFYAITLEVTSDIGCSTTFTDTLEVMALPVISADAFGPFCLNNGDIGVPTISPAAGNLTWNGASVTAFDTYDMGSGTHDFTYSFTNSNGCYNELTSQIVVNDTTTISFNTAFDPICVDASALNLTPYLSDGPGETSVLYDLTNWTVDPAFHTDSLQQNITSPLAVPIRYTYVNGDNCQSIIDDEIVVHPLPIADFSVNATCVGEIVVFTNNSSVNGSTFDTQEWSFDNNGVFSGSIPTNISYDTAGNYGITLEVTTTIGCTASMTDTLEIMALPVLTAEAFGPFCLNDGDVNTPVVTPTGGDFTIGGTLVSTFDTYAIGSGLHNYLYSFTDGNGCYNEITDQIQINDTTTIAYTAPFEQMCIDGEAFDLLPFLSHPTGETFVQYDLTTWTADSEFQIGNVDQNIVNPTAIPVLFTYTNNDECVSNLIDVVLVHPLPVISVIVPDICANENLVITNNSYINGSAIASINWNIEEQGDFDTYSLAPMSFDEPDTLTYTINITSAIGCYSADTSTFKIFTVPVADFDWIGACNNVPVEFTSGSTISSGELTGYTWIMDGSPNPGSSPTFNNLFTNYGTHEAGLIAISDNGCRDTLYQELYINPAPLGGMILSDHCLDTETSIVPDASIPEGEIVQMDWIASNEFGISSLEEFTHTFGAYGLFQVNQVLTSASGCTSIYSDEIRVYPLPELSFESVLDSVCSGQISTLVSTSSIAAPSVISSINWSIDRNRNFNGDSINFTLYNPGWAIVEMSGISDFGCLTKLVDSTGVKVLPKPEGYFVFDENPVQISDPTVSITDLSSEYVVEWMYDMGDGSVYWEPYPSHTYEEAGEYRVEQLVINAFGCSDTTFRVVRVEGFIVYVPNAFSPNGDGINEIFKPSVHGEDIQNYTLQIYNRNGNIVFESRDISNGWNGSSPNTSFYSENTVYTYYLMIQGETGNTQESRGSVTLVR